MKRIDRIISEKTDYSRKEIKKLISKGFVFANKEVVKHPEDKYDDNVSITIDGIEIDTRDHVYLVLNKPKGFVSTTDLNERSVLELVPDEYMTRELFPAGRLDKDTTGLMIITDDGEFAHNILSPKKHVQKIYEVTLDIPVTKEMKDGFLKGVNLSDGECKSAILDITGEYTCNVTLKEGRYHQIKRMFSCYKAKVVELNRICMGDFYLPKDLEQGEIRELTNDELELIQSR
ncbi:MAG: pseudouridine synthase [Bacilli bacterium]|nr:pseudouridine synthase [Bacilli bacterium]